MPACDPNIGETWRFFASFSGTYGTADEVGAGGCQPRGRPVAPNVLERHFEADHPNLRWTTDITFIWTWEGWLYLAVVLDLYARRVVGWAVQPHLQTELALEALQLALGRRVPAPGLVHPSDRGCQYAAEAYQRVLREHGIVCSMSRTGDCWDNAVTESFFATLKTELIHRQPWPTRRAAHGRRRGLHRRLLQSVPAALVARVSQPQRIRKTACAKRNVRSIINLSTFPREDHLQLYATLPRCASYRSNS